MDVALLLFGVGILTGTTTVLFGFGGGFVTVPVIVGVDAALGADAAHVAVATSSVVMVVNALVATAATDRGVLGLLRGRAGLVGLLALGGAAGAVAARFAPSALITWGFVGYVTGTIVDVLARPGFLRRAAPAVAAPGQAALATGAGLPIGAVASFLGVGGSVLTVPLLRRAGHPMRVATSLANPLTLAIATPALVVFLAQHAAIGGEGGVALVGAVDVGAAAALLAGALPVIVALRRRPPRIPDHVYAWTYVGLLAIVVVAMVATTV
ncbi:sulfite exporter TauE/SafE family protein [Prauserella endophytica]|uniref:Probable membrane transporter protein n=1 Tax=Prauserella endophytica TaxID=1592324 RepID=A0ABY2S4S8_9PSEU|nr:sulfite exporter TauE/SafE family protein [Prauserella endophytica]TKG70797.1 sulfite exporter TauE/SafE family protein [Prauserella endophytica]